MTKEELREYIWIKKNIAILEERLIEMQEAAVRITQHYSAEPTSKGGIPKGLDPAVIKIMDIKKQLSQELKRLYEFSMRIEAAILKLPTREQCLIRLKYVSGKGLEEISEEMNYSLAQINRIHGKALSMLYSQDDTK